MPIPYSFLSSAPTMDALASLARQHPGGDHPMPSEDTPPHDNSGAGGHQMSPFLFTRKTGYFVLFEGAFINSTGGFVGALILSFVFAIIATLLGQIIRKHESIALMKGSFVFRILASCLHGFRQFLHYAAMLIVMTMNVWLILAVVAGHAVGWLLYSVALHKRLNKSPTLTPDAKVADGPCDC